MTEEGDKKIMLEHTKLSFLIWMGTLVDSMWCGQR